MRRRAEIVSITSTSGNEWWIERTDGSGEQRYPISITVGRSFMTGRRYVPERTCRMKDGIGVTICCRCGAFVSKKAVSTLTEFIPARFCPNCGARVVGE